MVPPQKARLGFARTLDHPALLVLLALATPAAWLLFVATMNPHEMLVGLLASAATVVFTVFVCRSSSTSLKLQATDLIQCWRIPWYILSGSSEIAFIVIKDLLHIEPAKNLFRVCGFDTSAHDPLRMARTVMAVAYTTTAPNFIVIGVDPSQSRMIFHQLAPSSVPLMTKALGARG